MCGIIGQLVFHSSYSPEFDFNKLASLMDRRGPDGGGFWQDGKHCALGFRRLAILDLSSNGDQPMITNNGRFSIVFNGEVYNFPELRTELENIGVSFRSTSDTEVVLQALVHWGKKALSRFNGMFALGFYDSHTKKLLLARDFVGIKPLYFLKCDHGLFFASQYNQILAHPWRNLCTLNQDALGIYLRLGYIPAPYAIFNNTHMLEPGGWLEIDISGDISQGRYYELPPFSISDLHGAEAYEAVDSAVTAAVRRQMVSDVPIGTFLSGGIDSPLVAAKMCAVSNQKITAFTIGTHGSPTDESLDATAYANELGLEHILKQVTTEDALTLLEDSIIASGEPFADYSILPTLLVSRLASQRVKVVLSGDGGDELFWGYTDRFPNLIRDASFFQYPQWTRKLFWASKFLGPDANRFWNIQNSSTFGDRYKKVHTHLPEKWVQKIFPSIASWPDTFNLYNFSGFNQDEAAQWLRWNELTGHLTMVLLKVDRASMFNSLEVRVPLLDKEVIETAWRIDWQSCLSLESGEGKIPLRRSLQKHIYKQTKFKRGFGAPMAEWLRGPLRPIFEEKVINARELCGLEIDSKTIRNFYNIHLAGGKGFAWGLWTLLSLALWEENNL